MADLPLRASPLTLITLPDQEALFTDPLKAASAIRIVSSVFRCVLMTAHAFTSRVKRMASFLHLVFGIGLVSAQKQMMRIDAWWVVTRVANQCVARNLRDERFVAKSRRQVRCSKERKSPIPGAVLEGGPVPAACLFVDSHSALDSFARTKSRIELDLQGMWLLARAPLLIMTDALLACVSLFIAAGKRAEEIGF